MFQTKKRTKQMNTAHLTARRIAGFGGAAQLLAQIKQQVKGADTDMKARAWMRSHGGCYMPGGPHCNVRGTYPRNPKVIANIGFLNAEAAEAYHARSK